MLSQTMNTRDDHIYVALRECDVVFILPCKVASSSIRRALRQGQGMPINLPPDKLDYVSRAEAATFKHRIGFVRHPFTRLESCWADKFIKRRDAGLEFLPDFVALGFTPDMPFEAFVCRVAEIPDNEADGDGRHFRSQVFDLSCNGKLMPTFLGHFEGMERSWARAQQIVKDAGGPNLPPLLRLRQSDRSQAVWTERAREAAVNRYAADMGTFSYRCSL